MSLEVLLPWLAGVVAAPLIQLIKKQFGLEGKPAMWLTIGVSAVLGVAAAFLSGEVGLDDFSPEKLFSAVAKVIAVATALYKLLQS